MALIGYARVSTEEQQTDRSLTRSGPPVAAPSSRSAPRAEAAAWVELARCWSGSAKGDTLVVVRIDRLARSSPTRSR
jgi:DNA invertase Pin-like site-specific DNA recombinase